MTEHTTEITNDQGRRFTVRIVEKGQRYGLNDCLVHDRLMPLVEFYDLTHTGAGFGPLGQFVSRYYADTLLAREGSQGLDLCGHEPVWKLDAASFREARMWVSRIVHLGREG